MQIKPLGRRVLLKRITDNEAVSGGIHIPESARKKSQEARVIAIGTGKTEAGTVIDFDVGVGDTVLLPEYGGTEIDVDGQKHILLEEYDILGIVS